MRTLRRALPLALLALAPLAQRAAAESHKLIVLKSEGRADGATRAKIDAAIVKLAKVSEPQAAVGDISYGDAATAVGCKPEAATCKDEVIGMLAVDEIVITTVTPKPGGLEVAVRRVGKNGASRDAQMMIPTDAPPDKLDGVASLFGAQATVAPPEPVGLPGPTPTPPGPAPAPAPAPVGTVPPPSAITAEPAPYGPPTEQPVDVPSSRAHRLELAGMIGGGGMVLLGFMLWGAANSTQGDIDDAPVRTASDLKNLKDLEKRADSYAGWGNFFAIGGVIVGGVATYYYIRDRRRASAGHATLTPAVFPHGGGIALTFGGSP